MSSKVIDAVLAKEEEAELKKEEAIRHGEEILLSSKKKVREMLKGLEEEERKEVFRIEKETEEAIEELKAEYLKEAQEEIDILLRQWEGKKEKAVSVVVEKMFY